ncbi:MAG: glycosyltransferase family 4 protein [Chloroflexia bacterium]
MRIGIDAHMIGTRETGNETYCRGLIEGFAQLEDDNEYLIYLASPDVLPSVNGHGRLLRRDLRKQSNVWRLTLGFAQASRGDRLDLLHSSYNVPLFASCRLVVSVHDISFVHFPEFFSKRDLRIMLNYIPYSMKRAQQVITLSESAAQDIEQVYGIPRSKITVTPLAARAPFTGTASVEEVSRLRRHHGLEDPYILAVGNLQPRKNLLRLFEAFAQLPPSASDVKLAVVGKAQWKESEIYRRVTELQIEDRVVFTGYMDDEDLALLYQGSLGLVYPSIYEGFGLPILEAMACGAPVICSNTSSMPEVAGDAAILVDPLNVGEIAEAIASVVQSSAVREQLRERGRRQAALFSWENTARQTLEVYERCAN